MAKPKLSLMMEREGSVYFYRIELEVDLGDCRVYLTTSEPLTEPEANHRMIHLAAQLKADTDGFRLSSRSPVQRKCE